MSDVGLPLKPYHIRFPSSHVIQLLFNTPVDTLGTETVFRACRFGSPCSSHLIKTPTDLWLISAPSGLKSNMIFTKALGLIFTVCLKIQLSDCSCEISTGDKNLTHHPSSVIVVLNCSFPGSSFDSVQWTRNGQPVEQSRILRDPQKQTKWSAVALTNVPNYENFQCGKKRGEENCSVRPGKPKLRALKRVKIVDQGDSADIGKCRVDAGWPQPRVSWWRHGLRLRDGDLEDTIALTKITDKTTKLRIIYTEGGHHGIFTCRADNIFGTSEQEINVRVKRYNFIRWESDVKDAMVALEGTNTTLECTCSKDECKEKAATAYWKFKDHYISQSKRVKLSNATTVNGVRIIMTILNVSRIDDGEYVCGINTSLGFGEQTKRLRVLIKDSDTFPRVHATTNKVYADIQSPASLECIVTYPFILESPTTFWVFNGTLRITKDSRNYHQRNFKPNKANQTITQAFRLDIATVSVEYCGWYSCGVKFTVGQTTLTPSKGIKLEYNLIKWKLDVKDAMVALEGTNTTLECTCSKDECKEKAATAYWKFKDHYISQSNRVKLSNATTVNGVRIIMTILNVSRIDDGEYVCGINTPLGFGEETRRLRVLMKDSDTYPRVHATTNKVYADDDEIKSGELRKTVPEESPLIAISSITAGGIILGFAVAFVAYRLCRKKRNTEEPFFETPLNGNQFRYDVFVTFSSQDFNWVKKELIPLVEKHKLNYCIHDRDFEIGKPVVDNMAQSVYTSRKVLAVMSHNYMSSKFCRGELEMALYRSTELGDSSVIVMRIDGVDRGKLPKALRNRTFLDYNDFTERKNWEERLIRHLKPPPIEMCTESISEKAYTLLQNAEV